MKIKLITLLIFSLMSGVCYADCKEGAKVADKFMKSYYFYLGKAATGNSFESWLQKNKLVTEQFRTAYQQLVAQAKKEDPELGLDYDPVFNAQDYPDNGLKIVSCEESGLVTLGSKAKDWESFKVFAKVVKANKGWLVDGIGAINMPENQ